VSVARVLREALTFQYAELTVRFFSADTVTQLAADGSRIAFLCPEGSEADLEISCEIADLTTVEAPPAPGDNHTWVAVEHADGGQTLFFYGQVRGATREVYLSVAVDADFRTARALFRADYEYPDIIRIGHPIEEHLVTQLLIRRGCCVVHACTIVFDDLAYVFAGHSGAGKSTIAELGETAGGRVLSDDRTILGVRNDVAYAWGTPWHGSFRRGEPQRCRVATIFLLMQDSVDRVRPLSTAEAFGELFVRLVVPSRENGVSLQATDTLEALSDACPVAALHFTPTAASIAAARGFVAARGEAASLHIVI